MDHAKIRKEELFMEIKGGKGYTIADIEALPDGERAELIDGELFMMAPPMTVHQRILVKLIFEIETYIRKMEEIVSFFPRPLAFTLKKTTETTWNLTFR